MQAALKGARPAVALGLCLITAATLAQPAPGGGGLAPPSSPSTGQTPGAPGAPAPVPPSSATPPPASPAPGADIVRNNPAAPLPAPNLGSTAAVPPPRGYWRAEPFDIYPFLGVGVGWTNNLLGQSTDPISTALMAVSPRVVATTRSGAHTHSLRYGGSYGKYFDSPADDFAVHEFVASTVNQFSARADLTGTAYYLLQQDPRGLTSRTISSEPDRWTGMGAQMTAGYGARSAQGRLEFDLGLTDKQYKTNPAVTDNLNVSTVFTAGRFLYRTGPRTRLLTELRYSRFEYDTGVLTNDEVRLLGGFTWDVAASTTGTVRAGLVRKNFEQPALSDYSAFTADAALRYLIRSYSVVELAAGRVPSDSWGTGFFTVDTYLAGTWTHRWASYFSTRALLSYLSQDVRGASRTDTTTTANVGGYFDVRTWLRLGAELQFGRRSSDDPAFEYSRNLVLFTVGGTL